MTRLGSNDGSEPRPSEPRHSGPIFDPVQRQKITDILVDFLSRSQKFLLLWSIPFDF